MDKIHGWNRYYVHHFDAIRVEQFWANALGLLCYEDAQSYPEIHYVQLLKFPSEKLKLFENKILGHRFLSPAK
jgi:hypothetical protein